MGLAPSCSGAVSCVRLVERPVSTVAEEDIPAMPNDATSLPMLVDLDATLDRLLDFGVAWLPGQGPTGRATNARYRILSDVSGTPPHHATR